MNHPAIRNAEADDYRAIINILNEWWGGRQMALMLPKLFFVYFRPTSFVAEDNGVIVGFVIGFVVAPLELFQHALAKLGHHNSS